MAETKESLIEKYGFWGEYPNHPVAGWKYEIQIEDTRLGYWDWVVSCLESDGEGAAEIMQCAKCGDSMTQEASIDCPECGKRFCDNCYDTGFGDGCKCHTHLFRNYYICPQCGDEWTDIWEAACNDHCGVCGMKDIQPYKSEDV